MTIKRKIIGNTVGSALLVAAVGLLSAAGMLRIGNALRVMQVTESGRFRDVAQLESAAPGTALLRDSLALERGVRDETMRGLRDAHDRVITSVRLLIAAAAFAIILSLGMGLRVAMPLAARLARLRDGAVDVGKGRRQGHVEVGVDDEIGQLAQAFNEMADGVRCSRDEVRNNDAKYRELVEVISEVFWVSNTDCSKILYVSPAYEKVWGRSRESLYNHPLSFADAIVPEDRERVLSALGKMATLNQEYRMVRPDGTMRWIHARGFPVRGQIGQVLRVVGIAVDVTTQKTAEAAFRSVHGGLQLRMDAQTEELQLANESLRRNEAELRRMKTPAGAVAAGTKV